MMRKGKRKKKEEKIGRPRELFMQTMCGAEVCR